MNYKIIINGKIFTKKYITGVQRYTLEILKELDKLIEKDEIEICVPQSATNIPNYKNFKIVKYSHLKNILWEQFAFPLYVKKNKGISVNLGNVSPWIEPGIVCIHDINCIKNPHNFQFKMRTWYSILFKRAMKKAKQVITVSEFCKKEMLDYYKVLESQIQVTYNSWEHFKEIESDNKVFEKFPQLLQKDFFFSLGTLTKHKNLEWVLRVAKRNPQYLFAISGWVNIKKFKKKLDLETPDNVIYLGYLSDGEVKAIYQKEKALLFPALYEGFGLPPIEALSVGSKIVVADIPCMHEVFDNGAIYIDPYKYDVNLDDVLNTDVCDPELILQKYSWKKSAERLLSIIKEKSEIEENNN